MSLRAQEAIVRTLVEEVARHHPAEAYVVELHHQLSEELERLVALAPNAELPAERPIDVLVVDDEEASRVAAEKVLRALGYSVRTATNADEALREIAREPAAIVLSDWSMPGMSGLELCTVLKRSANPPYVILATGFHENGRLLEGVRSGVDDFLHKPIALEELEVRLMAASRLIRAQRLVEALRKDASKEEP